MFPYIYRFTIEDIEYGEEGEEPSIFWSHCDNPPCVSTSFPIISFYEDFKLKDGYKFSFGCQNQTIKRGCGFGFNNDFWIFRPALMCSGYFNIIFRVNKRAYPENNVNRVFRYDDVVSVDSLFLQCHILNFWSNVYDLSRFDNDNVYKIKLLPRYFYSDNQVYGNSYDSEPYFYFTVGNDKSCLNIDVIENDECNYCDKLSLLNYVLGSLL